MRIAYIHHNLARESGDPRMAIEIMRGLKAAGHEVIGYTFAFDPDIFAHIAQGLDIRKITTSADTVHGRCVALRKTVDAKADAVIFHNDFSYRIASEYKNINPRARTIWIMNNAPFECLPKQNIVKSFASRVKSAVLKQEVKKYMEGIDHIVVHDQKGKEFAQQLRKPATIIPIGVDYETFYAPVTDKNRTNRIQLLGVGSLSAYRRFEDIIGAVAILRKERRDARALIICKDDGRSSWYRKRLDDVAQREKVDQYVERRYEGASDAALREAYYGSDIYVFPNYVRIWGMSAFEGMAAGLPLIVSRITSVAEILTDGVDALFVDPKRPDQIAAQAARLMDDSGLYKRIAESGQRFVKERLGWNVYMNHFLHCISQ